MRIDGGEVTTVKARVRGNSQGTGGGTLFPFIGANILDTTGRLLRFIMGLVALAAFWSSEMVTAMKVEVWIGADAFES